MVTRKLEWESGLITFVVGYYTSDVIQLLCTKFTKVTQVPNKYLQVFTNIET